MKAVVQVELHTVLALALDRNGYPHAPCDFLMGKEPLVTFNMRLSGTPSQSGYFGEGITLLSHQDSNHRLSCLWLSNFIDYATHIKKQQILAVYISILTSNE
jgi:hypothetical protein